MSFQTSHLRLFFLFRFKVHHALHQIIEASRDSVVLIFLQDVHDYKLSRTLFLRRGMLRSSCILEWPPQKERVSAFYQKLFVALGLTNRLQEWQFQIWCFGFYAVTVFTVDAFLWTHFWPSVHVNMLFLYVFFSQSFMLYL